MRPTGSRMQWPTALAVLGLALLASGVMWVVVLWARDGASAAGDEASLLEAVLGATGVAATVIGWAARRRAARLRPATGEQVGRAAATLAEVVREQWTAEAQVRALGDPEPMPVRWRLTTRDVMDHPAVIKPDGPLSFAGRSDRIGALADAFRALPRRRLVITGGPGTGKTTLAMQLLLELLPPPDVAPTEPVPVLFSLVGWDPAAQPRIQDWLAAQLDQTYPALGAIAPDAAAALVARGRVLPVLDGLDEIAETRRPAVVSALNASVTSGLILTSRRPEYRAAVAAAGDVITAAATIGPLALSPAEAADYLRKHLPPRPGPAWTTALTELRSGAGALATVTATPFGLWLVRTVYVDARRDPGDLVDGAHPTVADLRRHLLEQLVPAAVDSRPAAERQRRADPAASSRPVRRHDPDDLRRWLAVIAEQLRDTGSRDWTWWELPRRVFGSRRARIVVGLTVGLAVLVLDLALGMILVMIMEAGDASAALDGARLGAAIGLPLALAVGFAAARSCSRGAGPRHADFGYRGRGRELAVGLAGGALRGAGVGAVVGLAIGIIAWAAEWLPGVDLTGLPLDMLVFGLLMGVPSGAMYGWIKVVGRVDPGQKASTPTASHRADRFVVRITVVGGVVAAGLTLGPFYGLNLDLWEGLRRGLLAAALTGLLVGMPIAAAIGLSRHPSPAVVLATVWSALRGRLPWRLMPTLDDAYRLGLLRAVGPVYQFRHAELQDHLAPPVIMAVAGTAAIVVPAAVESRDPAATA